MIDLQYNDIMQYIDYYYNYLITNGINPRTILYIAVVGSQNYHIAKEDTPLHCIAVILPTYEQVCFLEDPLDKQFHLKAEIRNKDILDIKDIRSYRSSLLAADLQYLETLFTEYYYLNDEYSDLFIEYLLNHNDEIVYANEFAVLGQIVNEIDQLGNKQPFGYKDFYELNRLYYCLQQFVKHHSFKECLQPPDKIREQLWQMRYPDFNSFQQTKNERQTEIKRILRSSHLMAHQYLPYKDTEESFQEYILDNTLNQGILHIMSRSFQGQAPASISYNDFIKLLTPEECHAYNEIVKAAKQSNFITQKSLNNVPNNHIYVNVLEKMKHFNLATIKRMGPQRGTYIKLKEENLYE